MGPEGAFYIHLDSRAMAERLLDESGSVLTPETLYGPAGQGWLRLSSAGSLQKTIEGLRAMGRALAGWHNSCSDLQAGRLPYDRSGHFYPTPVSSARLPG
ncbi:hypothetical protein BH23CHL2_BH23CHL2_14690 [soil metagenome]